MRGPLAVLHDLWCEPELDTDLRSSYEYVIELRERLQGAAEIAAMNSKVKSDVYKMYFDKKSVKRSFKKDDEVLLLLPDNSNKLLMSWKGPYRVLEVKSRLNYVIDVNGTPKLYHINMLKAYVRRATVGNMCTLDEMQTLESVGLNSEQLINTCIIPSDGCDGPLPTIGEAAPTLEYKINPDLTIANSSALRNLLSDYSKILSDLPGCTSTLTHEIVLNTTDVVCKRNYPVPIHLKEFFDSEVDRMLEMYIITPSKSNFCSCAKTNHFDCAAHTRLQLSTPGFQL